MTLKVRRCDILTARIGVARLHRHLKRPPPGALVAFECVLDRWPIGWALVGRPVSRVLQARGWVEVNRCVHDGTRNAGSALYGACARWAREMGHPIITYTLPSESGASLRGAGWIELSHSRGGYWSRDGRPRKPGPVDGISKLRWASPWSLDAVDSTNPNPNAKGPDSAWRRVRAPGGIHIVEQS